MEIITGFVGLIALITFFVMAVALSNISSNIKVIKKVVESWAKETGYGMTYKCIKCKKPYEGKQPVCPHCGEPKVY